MQNQQIITKASHQWATRPQDQRFRSLRDLREAVEGRRMRSRSVDLDVARMEVSDASGRLLINGTIDSCEPTHWSFGQLASAVKAPAAYLRTLPTELVTRNLNWGLRESGIRDTVKFMTVADEEGENPNTLQAVTSPGYGRIWDADVVKAVQEMVEKTGNKFYNPPAYSRTGGEPEPSGLYASDHDVFMFLIDGGSFLEGFQGDRLCRGFMVWNSETGAKSLGGMTFLHRGVCGNNIVWGAEDVNQFLIRHTSGGPYRFATEAAPRLKAYVQSDPRPIEAAIRKAQDYLLPAEDENGAKAVKLDGLVKWLPRYGRFSKGEVKSAMDVAKAEEGDCRTLWHLIQGFTAHARGFDFIDARVDLERRAGKLMEIVAGN